MGWESVEFDTCLEFQLQKGGVFKWVVPINFDSFTSADWCSLQMIPVLPDVI